MKNVSTLFLKFVVIILGVAVLAICIFLLPYVARESASAYPDYWVYPVILGAYLSAVPFYFALYQAIIILNLIDTNTAFSLTSVKAIKNIRNSAFFIGLIYLAVAPCFYFVADIGDAPGILLINLIIIGASAVVAVFAAVLQKLLQNAIEIKSENDLTV